jgi:hypothetical protein
MDGWSPDRLAAPGTLGLGPRHAGNHALADDRPFELAEHRQHSEHGATRGRVGVEPLLVQK